MTENKEQGGMYLEIELKSGRTVHMREPTIDDQEAAITVAGERNGNNQLLQGFLAQRELLKLLIVAVDGKKLSGSEKENIKNMFSLPEHLELNKVMEDLVPNPTKPKVKTVSSFGKN